MTQIAVKLPDHLVAALDRLVMDGAFESRSSAVRHGIAVVVAAHRRDAVDLSYAEGYGSHPDTELELQQATRLAIDSINDEPWDRWW